ncbi:MAG: hypothetical protein KJ634_07610 [Gammaproteobacteria bacterium]|nr:hypothetical protein [Gammaproteobacteria bacterium]MBU1415475.1 hypothetical protein [Gammaproteobacteria bacterium]
MPTIEWRDLVLLLTGFVLSIVGALLGAYLQRRLDRIHEQRPLNQLLNFGSDALLFIFPHREEISEAILPRTSTEDFLSMNNFISALISIDWPHPIGVRDTRHVSADDKRRNLVVICSPKSNTFANELQAELVERGVQAFEFAQKSGPQWVIDIGDGKLESKSFSQEKEYLGQNIPRSQLSERMFEDLAIVTKIQNPWNSRNKIIWLAGIRGIGTWAAGECMKKHWQQIYDALPERNKECDFSALLRVQYSNCDITRIEVRQVRVLPQLQGSVA